MRKTSVYLTDAQAERLAFLAKRERRPQAEIIRDAIATYAPPRPSERKFTLDGVVAGDATSIGDVDEDELLRGFGE